MNKSLSVGAVSYLNTRPLLFGIKRSGLMNKMRLVEAYPGIIADQLLNNQIDIGLVPVAIIPKLNKSYLITDYCIGTEGEVASVAIFSDVPLEEVKTLLLDYQSRTSINLAKILIKEYWKMNIKLVNAGADYRNEIRGTTAGVVIGDRALEQQKISKYSYDLGAAWKAYTGLPFVFATWVANKTIDNDFIDAFNRANAYGVNHIEEVLESVKYEHYDLRKYYTENLSYQFTDDKKKGLDLFLQKLANIQ